MQTSPLWTNVLWLWIQYDFYHEGLAQTLHNYNLCLQTVMEFIFLGSKITADGDCSREIKKTLVPWKKTHDKPRQHIKKQRHYFAKKFWIVKALVFPVVIYGCESWTIKKAEYQIIDAF